MPRSRRLPRPHAPARLATAESSSSRSGKATRSARGRKRFSDRADRGLYGFPVDVRSFTGVVGSLAGDISALAGDIRSFAQYVRSLAGDVRSFAGDVRSLMMKTFSPGRM